MTLTVAKPALDGVGRAATRRVSLLTACIAFAAEWTLNTLVGALGFVVTNLAAVEAFASEVALWLVRAFTRKVTSLVAAGDKLAEAFDDHLLERGQQSMILTYIRQVWLSPASLPPPPPAPQESPAPVSALASAPAPQVSLSGSAFHASPPRLYQQGSVNKWGWRSYLHQLLYPSSYCRLFV